MRIHIIGSTHQTASLDTLRGILDLLTTDIADEVTIDSRFFSYLMQHEIAPLGVKTYPLSGTIDTDLMVCIGGDGTFLRGAKLVAGTEAGIIGLNSGHLGFLSSMQPDVLSSYWEEIRSGRAQVDERATLEAVVTDPDGRVIYQGIALNEVSVIRRDILSMIRVTTKVCGQWMVDYQADGVLVSTPTGSSAYALSVGGPLVHPNCSSLLIVPIAPHSLTMRPILIPDSMTIDFAVSSRSGTFAIALDGRGKDFPDNCRVTVRKSDRMVRVLHTSGYQYFENLRKKLMWGADSRSVSSDEDETSHCPTKD